MDYKNRNYKSRYIFKSAVTEGVILVGFLGGEFEAEQRNKRRACIGKIVTCICHNGNRAGQRACNKFDYCKKYVQKYTHKSAQYAVA